MPIPSEEDVRTVRQLPLEVDPPEQTEFRKIVEPFFRRATQPDYIKRVDSLIGQMLDQAAKKESVETVRDFALPLQSRALTFLLNVPAGDAEIWIGWGTHVFRDPAKREGMDLNEYVESRIDQAYAAPGGDFFSALTQATYQGRALTREEITGYANIAFAGGRDTIINAVTCILAYVAEHPEALGRLRENPKLIITATEEFLRAYSPNTHLGRTCPADTDVHGVKVSAGERVSLCWASANFDETVFEAPEEVRLDRKPNPHIAFGFGVHNCLGAPHARLIMRSLLQELCARLDSLQLLEAVKNEPNYFDYQREVGYKMLTMKFNGRDVV